MAGRAPLSTPGGAAEATLCRFPYTRRPMEPARALLAWYDRGHRDLPWRRSRDPWAIWVSEVMLQQTRVETVGRYYERFLARFPDPRALAEASTEELLAHWSGLGYYRRARSLQQAARSLAGAPVPANATELARLPGVGPYTAARWPRSHSASRCRSSTATSSGSSPGDSAAPNGRRAPPCAGGSWSPPPSCSTRLVPATPTRR